MKIFVNMLLWTTEMGEEHLSLLPRLKEMGYDGVEVPVFGGERQWYRRLGEAIRAAGLECTAVSCAGPEHDAASVDPAVREAARLHLRQIVDLCGELGTDLLVGPLFAAHAVFGRVGTMAECRRRSAAVIKDVARYAAGRGISLSLEFLNRFETYLLNCSEDVAAYLDLVDESNVGILYDTHHANIEEKSIPRAFGRHGGSFNHIHFSESHRGIVGEGQVDWELTRRSLMELDYQGRIVIEAFAHDVEGIATAACVWRPLFGDKMELCRKSLDFTRSLLPKHAIS